MAFIRGSLSAGLATALIALASNHVTDFLSPFGEWYLVGVLVFCSAHDFVLSLRGR